jgi:hypothetical protein
MIYKLVCTEFEDKQAANKRCNIEGDIVEVDHFEKSVIWVEKSVFGDWIQAEEAIAL